MLLLSLVLLLPLQRGEPLLPLSLLPLLPLARCCNPATATATGAAVPGTIVRISPSARTEPISRPLPLLFSRPANSAATVCCVPQTTAASNHNQRESLQIVARSARGQTVAHLAAQNGHLNVLEYLSTAAPGTLTASDTEGESFSFQAC